MYIKTKKTVLWSSIVFLLFLVGAFFVYQNRHFTASLLNNSNEGFFLHSPTSSVMIGESFLLEVQITSTQEVSKVALGLEYDVDSVRFEEYHTNPAAYQELALAKTDTTHGTIYIADGRKQPASNVQKELFATLRFTAIKPGKPSFSIVPSISKLHIGTNYSPNYFSQLLHATEHPIEIKEPHISVQSDISEKTIKPTVASFTINTTIPEDTLHPLVVVKHKSDTTPWELRPKTPLLQKKVDFITEKQSGLHTVEIWIQDIYGNWLPSSGPLAISYTIDNTAPQILPPLFKQEILNDQGEKEVIYSKYTNKTQPTFEVRTLDEKSAPLQTEISIETLEKHILINKHPVSNGSYTSTENLAAGEYIVTLTTQDALKNTATNSGSIVIDTTAPLFLHKDTPGMFIPTKTGTIYSYETLTADKDIRQIFLQLYSKNEKKLLKEIRFAPNASQEQFLQMNITNDMYFVITLIDHAGNSSTNTFNTASYATDTYYIQESAKKIQELEKKLQEALTKQSPVTYVGGGGGGGYSATTSSPTPQKQSKTESRTNTNSSPTKNTQELLTTYFYDIQGHWAQNYLETIVKKGIMKGYQDTTIRPNASITRAEFLKMIITAKALSTKQEFATKIFSDVPPSEWYAPYVYTAVEEQFVQGYANNTFKPHAPINRAEAVKILWKAFAPQAGVGSGKSFSDVRPQDWFYSYVQQASSLGIVSGYSDGSFHPERSITRAESAKILSYFLQ